MALSAEEQYLLELINRARLNPVAEALRYGVDLNEGLAAGTISDDAKQALSPNALLNDSSEDHSIWMLENDVFSHYGSGGSDPGDRMAAAGYVFTEPWSWRENLAWTGTTGTVVLAEAIEEHHRGLYLSEGHRENTFAEEIREIGIAQVRGDFTHNSTTYDSSMLTMNYAATGYDSYVTGVIYDDTDNDDFYSIGEGLSGYWVAADGDTTTTAFAGGYGLAVTATDGITVDVGLGTSVLATVIVDASLGNVKVDVLNPGTLEQTLKLSNGGTLVSGITDATLDGTADAALAGSNAGNALTGNAGNNLLSGAGGNDLISGGAGRASSVGESTINNDILLGGAGNDDLFGQSGTDRLVGGAGDDNMTGGSGRDTFVFKSGNDRILDYAQHVDTISFETTKTLAEVMELGRIVGGDAVFDFGDGNVLTIEFVTDLNGLVDDLQIA